MIKIFGWNNIEVIFTDFWKLKGPSLLSILLRFIQFNCRVRYKLLSIIELSYFCIIKLSCKWFVVVHTEEDMNKCCILPAMPLNFRISGIGEMVFLI